MLPVREYLLIRDYPGNVQGSSPSDRAHQQPDVGPGPITIGDFPEEDIRPMRRRKRTGAFREFERAIAQALSLGIGLKEISQAAADTATRIAVREKTATCMAPPAGSASPIAPCRCAAPPPPARWRTDQAAE